MLHHIYDRKEVRMTELCLGIKGYIKEIWRKERIRKGSEDGNSDTEEEETADSEHRKNEDGEVVEEEEDTHEKCSKEHFMNFIFEIKDFLNSKSKKKLARYVAREMKKVKERNGIDDSESDIPQNNDGDIQDVEQISDDFGEIGRECFKTCSKRKIKSIIEIINVLTDDDSLSS